MSMNPKQLIESFITLGKFYNANYKKLKLFLTIVIYLEQFKEVILHK